MRNFRQPTMLSDKPNWFDDFFSLAGSIFVKLTTMFPYMPLLIWRVFFFLARAHLSDNCLSNNSLLCGLVYLVEPRTFTFSQLQHRTARQKIWLYTPINQLKKQLYSWDFIDVMWMVEKCVEGQNFHRTQSLYISQVELTWIMYLFFIFGHIRPSGQYCKLLQFWLKAFYFLSFFFHIFICKANTNYRFCTL